MELIFCSKSSLAYLSCISNLFLTFLTSVNNPCLSLPPWEISVFLSHYFFSVSIVFSSQFFITSFEVSYHYLVIFYRFLKFLFFNR
mmetsp:Transcript_11090/g.1721  ORF Transcript_11090/g.1721 Transcript_11090/m.1721 type:complete len:86 (-) Transcript_11090:288-545(-)